ncbi:hypothetical protein DICVIV_10359 [Dictyocaulus viviparus]|uniref:Uncharacterized protein n=1 Tax=Dictyocaulus viviparus TaxID=29172 RepID=A0A0D8XIN1_DICVI|nr:hypothetical protein DICVIV_10359 [Dictyocaulus viviparus]
MDESADSTRKAVDVAVDILRAILYPRTVEESLCSYVVAAFITGWITILTIVISCWLYYRVPIPHYTYELVIGGDIQQVHREAASNDGETSAPNSKETTPRLKAVSLATDDHTAQELFMLAEMETQREVDLTQR